MTNRSMNERPLLAVPSLTVPTTSRTNIIVQIVVEIIWKIRKVFGLSVCRASMTMDAMSRIKQRAMRTMITTTTL
jgi:hypothetical protein